MRSPVARTPARPTSSHPVSSLVRPGCGIIATPAQATPRPSIEATQREREQRGGRARKGRSYMLQPRATREPHVPSSQKPNPSLVSLCAFFFAPKPRAQQSLSAKKPTAALLYFFAFFSRSLQHVLMYTGVSYRPSQAIQQGYTNFTEFIKNVLPIFFYVYVSTSCLSLLPRSKRALSVPAYPILYEKFEKSSRHIKPLSQRRIPTIPASTSTYIDYSYSYSYTPTATTTISRS